MTQISAISPAYVPFRAAVRSLLAQGRNHAALDQLVRLQRSLPRDIALLTDLADCHWALGDGERARALVTSALEAAPHVAPLWAKAGQMALATGDKVTAGKALREALRLDPNSPTTLSNLDRVSPFSRSGQKTRRLKALAAQDTLTASQRAIAFTTLGRIEERAGKYGPAFRYYKMSNTLCGGTYDADLFTGLVTGIEDRFQGVLSPLKAIGSESAVIFVTGMPRSGTTLVESIFGRHPDVATIGESPLLQDALNRLRREVANDTGDRSPWNWVPYLSAARARELRDWILTNMRERCGPRDGMVLLDKLPLNIFELGFARAILPEARFIYMSRHPMDVGLSNFITNMGDKHPFSQDLRSIAHVMQSVEAAADLYSARGIDLFRQSYRALVEAPETNIRRLLSHAGLSWAPECMSPELRSGIVRTASITQVRAPINRSALGKWQNYVAQLKPLSEALGDAWLLDWETRDAGKVNRLTDRPKEDHAS